MGQAKISIDAFFLQDMIFGFADEPVLVIGGGSYDPVSNRFSFEIVGNGVPDCEEAIAIVTRKTNRAGERFHTMEFKPIDELNAAKPQTPT